MLKNVNKIINIIGIITVMIVGFKIFMVDDINFSMAYLVILYTTGIAFNIRKK